MKFSEQVFKARMKLQLSQETMAKELGVAFSTLNRWEKGHTNPNYLKLNRFYEFCAKHRIKFDE